MAGIVTKKMGGGNLVIGGNRVEYFQRPIPPVRDTLNRPLKNGEIDTRKWIDEVNEGKWPPK